MLARIRGLVARQCTWWCIVGLLLVAAQPLIGAHFSRDGLEDEGEIHVHSAAMSVELEADDDGLPGDVEITVYVPSAASIDLPQAFQQGIDHLLTLVLLLLPLLVLIAPFLSAFRSAARHRPLNNSGASPPPPTAPWHRLPPETAPPCPN